MEFQSTFKGEPPVSETCVVYDQRDGRIVLVHEFIGDGTGVYGSQGKDERARIALQDAAQHAGSGEHLQVLHLERDFRPAANTVYRVDVAAGTLVPQRLLAKASLAQQQGAPAKIQSK